MEAQNSAKSLMANSIDQTVSVYCEQEVRNKTGSGGKVDGSVSSVCKSNFSSKNIELGSKISRTDECVETVVRGDPGYEAEVHRVYIRYVVPIDKLGQ